MSRKRADFGLAIERLFADQVSRNGAALSGRHCRYEPPVGLISGGAVMEEDLHGELSLHDRRHDDGCSTVPSLAKSGFLSAADRFPAQVWTVSARINDLPPGQGSPLWAAPDVPLLRRDETKVIAPLEPISRVVATIRLWRRRVRSRQELRELNDHLLKDIGISRATADYEVAKRFWR
jgi:uncharacterized protein YjiS (DUF1127 family)